MKICLAGTSTFVNIVDLSKSKYILESFYYFKDWQLDLVKNKELFLLDSGAFTFMNSKKMSLELIEQYQEKYIDFLKQTGIKYFFNIDIDTIYGIQKSKAQHFCMKSRGIKKQEASMVTSAIRGAFAKDNALRQEFLSLIRG